MYYQQLVFTVDMSEINNHKKTSVKLALWAGKINCKVQSVNLKLYITK